MPFFLSHRFPNGVSCWTDMSPHGRDDQTTVEQTGQVCACNRVCVLTSPSFTYNLSHKLVAKWTRVTKTLPCDSPFLHREFVSTDVAMVHLPCRNVTRHLPIASGANVSIRQCFRNDASVRDLETVTACAAMIYSTCPYAAGNCLFAIRTNILESLVSLGFFSCLCRHHLCLCFSCLCRHRLLLTILGCLVLFRMHISFPFPGLVCPVFALLCSPHCFPCLGIVHVSFHSLFFCCAGILGICGGSFCPLLYSPFF